MVEIPAWFFWLLIGLICVNVILPHRDIDGFSRWMGHVIDAAVLLPLFFIFARGY